MDEYELAVIEAAIEYVRQKKHGLYRDEQQYYERLKQAVDNLELEHEGNWEPRGSGS